MDISSGIAIIYNKKILLCHPTSLPFSIPKGGVSENESIIDAAIRETKEEVGIDVSKSQISNINDPIEVLYINKKGVLFKKVFVFILKIKNLSELGLDKEIIDNEMLQKSEVDWAGFMTKEESSEKIFYRFIPILNLI